jgi:hypothetical protein
VADLQLDCPHPGCLTEKAGFHGNQFYQIHVKVSEYILLLRCRVCGNGVIGKFRGDNFSNWASGTTPQTAPTPELIETWPKRNPIEAPAHVPDNVRRFYLQGTDNISRKNFDAAGTMFRKALDSSLRKLHPSGKGTLQKRIESLPEDVGITPAMKEWAHQIRELGNEAAHQDEPFSDAEARTLNSFTEIFLIYAFTMPGMLEERRAAMPLDEPST